MSILNKKSKDIEESSEVSVKKSLEFMSWIQEFSKKVVVITFMIFIIANLFFFGVITFEFYTTSELIGIEIFISEMHSTFRDVIGGYLIKSAIENSIKIGGGVVNTYLEMKLNSVTNCNISDIDDPMSPSE